MVFPSLPISLDPPNWSQQQPNQQEGISTQNPQISPPLQPPPPTIAVAAGGGGYQASIRPGSMADRARLAKIHQPDVTLKCPRCESTNTKFCYYNNYSLLQPRHFCKTCRRYWTRGGALRNVPVGGGCRRNKRSKGTSSARSKSPMKHDHRHGSNSASANSSSSGCTNNNDLMGHLQTPSPTQLPFLPTLYHYSGDASPLFSGGTGLHFGPTPSSLVVRNGNNTSDAEFEIGTNGGSVLSHNGLAAQWRLPSLQQVHQLNHQQFPNFLTSLEPQVGVFQFGHHHGENNGEYVRDHGGRFRSNNNNKASMDDASVGGGIMPQVNTVKMEENNQGLSLSKNNVLGNGSSGNDLFWSNGSGNTWSEVPGFTSSTSHLLS